MVQRALPELWLSFPEPACRSHILCYTAIVFLWAVQVLLSSAQWQQYGIEQAKEEGWRSFGQRDIVFHWQHWPGGSSQFGDAILGQRDWRFKGIVTPTAAHLPSNRIGVRLRLKLTQTPMRLTGCAIVAHNTDAVKRSIPTCGCACWTRGFASYSPFKKQDTGTDDGMYFTTSSGNGFWLSQRCLHSQNPTESAEPEISSGGEKQQPAGWISDEQRRVCSINQAMDVMVDDQG
jgi:hypothetical protein